MTKSTKGFRMETEKEDTPRMTNEKIRSVLQNLIILRYSISNVISTLLHNFQHKKTLILNLILN